MFSDILLFVVLIIFVFLMGVYCKDIFHRDLKNDEDSDTCFLSREVKNVQKINLVKTKGRNVLFVSRSSNPKNVNMLYLSKNDELVITCNPSSFDIAVYSEDDECV